MNYNIASDMGSNIASDMGSGPYVATQTPILNEFSALLQELYPTVSTDTLIDQEVWNHANEQLGVVQHFMLDTGSGRISYVVLSTGGFLGLDNRLLAVPWGALTLDRDQHHFILDETADRLQRAPGFDKHDWPDMADSRWANSIHNFYGTEGQAPYN